MIELVRCARNRNKLTSIDSVPENALPIVKKYESLFDQDSVYEEGKWYEFSDLPLEEAEKLKQELIAAGFECDVVENPWYKEKSE